MILVNAWVCVCLCVCVVCMCAGHRYVIVRTSADMATPHVVAEAKELFHRGTGLFFANLHSNA